MKFEDLKDMDVTTYPQGFETVCDALDFLPKDKQIRENFLMKFFITIIKR